MKRSLLTAAILMAFVVSVAMLHAPGLVSTASAQGLPPGRDLFGSASAPPGYTPPDGTSIVRSRFVEVDFSQLSPQTPEVILNLFDDTVYTASLASSTVPDPQNPNRFVWLGTLNGVPDGHVTLAVNDGSVSATLMIPGALYHVIDTGQGVHFVKQTTLNDPMPEDEPIPIQGANGAPYAPQGPLADDGSIIDVAVFYTPLTVIRYGEEGIQSKIDLAVAETNQAFLNSQINTQLRLVYSGLVNYTETSSMSTDLGRLRSKTDGYMDDVHALRDTAKADLVSLIVENSSSCGLANMMTTLSVGFEVHAFSVVSSTCATGYYSFGHELAHNIGSHHDRSVASTAMYPYAFGYWAPDYSYRTVMAYDCPVYCQRVPYFSNPNVIYGGYPTGISYDPLVTPNVSADNALMQALAPERAAEKELIRLMSF